MSTTDPEHQASHHNVDPNPNTEKRRARPDRHGRRDRAAPATNDWAPARRPGRARRSAHAGQVATTALMSRCRTTIRRSHQPRRGPC
jgi:hypothetical protein